MSTLNVMEGMCSVVVEAPMQCARLTPSGQMKEYPFFCVRLYAFLPVTHWVCENLES